MKNLTEQQERKYLKAKKKVKAISGFYKHFLVYILVNLFLISLKYINLDPGEKFFEFSTFSTAFFWGFGVAFHAAGVFRRNIFLGQDWEERKINEIMEKEKKHKWE